MQPRSGVPSRSTRRPAGHAWINGIGAGSRSSRAADNATETAAAELVEATKSSEARSTGARSIKVETAKLDYLVDMVGEMVISQSLIRHDPDLSPGRSRAWRAIFRNWRASPTIVQRTAMSMRMIPMGQLFQKMSRLVRDLSRKAGKLVELELAGEETELDRNIVEELADPLMHMVRNSVDHGIETAGGAHRGGQTGASPCDAQSGPPGRPHRDRRYRTTGAA